MTRQNKAQSNQAFKSKLARLVLILLVWATLAADLGTFLASRTKAFEINPVYLLTGSVLAISLVKLFAVALLSIFIWLPKIVPRTLYYSILLSSIYLILWQGLGAYSNRKTTIANPPEEQALPREEALQAYNYLAVFAYLLPVILGTLGFWLHEQILTKGD